MRLRLLGLLLLPVLAGAECPSGKNAWRDWGRARAERLLTDGFQPWNFDAVVEGLEECPPEPAFKGCLANLARFSRARWLGFQPGHSLGLPFPDKDYFEKVPYPDFLELPRELAKPEFLAWLDDESNPASLDKALAYVASVNPQWLTFLYRSQHLPTPDGTGALGRFFVYVPGKDFDRFFQFGLRHDPAKKLPHGLSVVAIQKTDPATGKPLDRHRARAKDFWRLRSADGDVTISTRFKEKGSLENCYDCHKTALLPITPDPRHFDRKRFGPTVALVNRIMGRYGDARLDGIDPGDYGPGLGAVDPPERTKDFLLTCAQGKVTTDEGIARLADAMNCQGCHDGETRGKLDYPSARFNQPTSQRSLVDSYVTVYRRMPPGHASLTAGEREALVACLRQEHYGSQGSFKRWLLHDKCWDALP